MPAKIPKVKKPLRVKPRQAEADMAEDVLDTDLSQGSERIIERLYPCAARQGLGEGGRALNPRTNKPWETTDMVALEATYLIRSDIDDPDSPAQVHYLDISEFSRLSLPLLAVGKASDLRTRPKEDWSYEARPLVRSIVPTAEFESNFMQMGFSRVKSILVCPVLHPEEAKEYVVDPVAFRRENWNKEWLMDKKRHHWIIDGATRHSLCLKYGKGAYLSFADPCIPEPMAVRMATYQNEGAGDKNPTTHLDQILTCGQYLEDGFPFDQMAEMMAAWMGHTSVRVLKQEYVTMTASALTMEEVKHDLKRPHHARMFTQDWLVCPAMKDLSKMFWPEGADGCVLDKAHVMRGECVTWCVSLMRNAGGPDKALAYFGWAGAWTERKLRHSIVMLFNMRIRCANLVMDQLLSQWGDLTSIPPEAVAAHSEIKRGALDKDLMTWFKFPRAGQTKLRPDVICEEIAATIMPRLVNAKPALRARARPKPVPHLVQNDENIRLLTGDSCAPTVWAEMTALMKESANGLYLPKRKVIILSSPPWGALRKTQASSTNDRALTEK